MLRSGSLGRVTAVLALCLSCESPSAQATDDQTLALLTIPSFSSVAGNIAANACDGVGPGTLTAAGASLKYFGSETGASTIASFLKGVGVARPSATMLAESASEMMRGRLGAVVGVLSFGGAAYLFFFSNPEQRDTGCKATLQRIMGASPASVPERPAITASPSLEGPLLLGEPKAGDGLSASSALLDYTLSNKDKVSTMSDILHRWELARCRTDRTVCPSILDDGREPSQSSSGGN